MSQTPFYCDQVGTDWEGEGHITKYASLMELNYRKAGISQHFTHTQVAALSTNYGFALEI